MRKLIIIAFLLVACGVDPTEAPVEIVPQITWLSWSDNRLCVSVADGDQDIAGCYIDLFENGFIYNSEYIYFPPNPWLEGVASWDIGYSLPHPGVWRIDIFIVDVAGHESEIRNIFIDSMKSI